MTLEILDFSSNEERWYLVHCKPRKEFYAADSLKNVLGLTVFLPETPIRSRGEVRHIPFFPGYLFVYTDLYKVSLSQINNCPGVLRLVEFGGDPHPVPQCVIETISEQLDKLNAIAPCHGLNPGDTVRVKHGPLQDLKMVFVGPTTPSKRVYVLLELLGRIKEAQVEVEMLEKISAPVSSIQRAQQVRKRYTRGKGRKIKYST